jgi:hypothetical protein
MCPDAFGPGSFLDEVGVPVGDADIINDFVFAGVEDVGDGGSGGFCFDPVTGV